MSKTAKNLMDAFAGESQANRTYLAFAKQAEKEGFPQAAKLFRAAAEAETIHALTHFRNAGKVNSTMDNLKDALAGETHEYTNMYPQMVLEAKEEGNSVAERYFAFANAVEEVHANLYKKAIDNGAKSPETDYYLCPVCGYTHEGKMEEKCPVCNAAGSSFYTVG